MSRSPPADNLFDAIVLGAGGAGLMCALQAGRRGRRIAVLDHAAKVGGKILISGGGRCNFTNVGAGPGNFVSQAPDFCRAALTAYPPEAFVRLVKEHRIPFYEKKLGQLFCERSARDIVEMLRSECERTGAHLELECKIKGVARIAGDLPYFEVTSSKGAFLAPKLVVATGGLSIPQMGATGLGYQIAQQFGLRIVARHPALDGFLFSDEDGRTFAELSGISIDCRMNAGGLAFRENLLFTHKGLSGPASLQASLHWNSGAPIVVDLLPDFDVLAWLRRKRADGQRAALKNLLAEKLPARFAEFFVSRRFDRKHTLFDIDERKLESFAAELKAWTLHPKSTVGYHKAEVTRGGVDTAELSDTTLETKKQPGLFFVGEVVDVTGWLGGYNFQWAWASGFAAAQRL